MSTYEMEPKLNLLIEKFPELYKSLPGFECNDGWFDLLHELSTKIIESGIPIHVQQVKEKFGTLRFYYYNIDQGDDPDITDKEAKAINKLDELIREAEKKSAVTCELCGQPGQEWVSRGWYYVACEQHKRPFGEPAED